MATQFVFNRYELKYCLSLEQKERIIEAMMPYMLLDQYGRTTIRNIYYDTDTYQLIRQSIESPQYKEKLRMRSYSQVSAEDPVFVELKKKYDSVVYKRRLSLKEAEATEWLSQREEHDSKTQIGKEIDYFLKFYQTLKPVLFLSYEREAFCPKTDSDFRVTFDDTILCREEALSLQEPVWGTPVLPKDQVLMEIKCSGAIPMWMVSALSRNQIRKTSFSKYGAAYKQIIFPKIQKKCSGGNI